MAEDFRVFMQALLADMDDLKKEYNKSIDRFNRNLDRQIEVHESLLKVHRDIIDTVQDMSQYMVENFIVLNDIKIMINGIVGMTAEIQHTYTLLSPEKLCQADKCPFQQVDMKMTTDVYKHERKDNEKK